MKRFVYPFFWLVIEMDEALSLFGAISCFPLYLLDLTGF
jgi:hypothetical protein